MGLRGTLIQIRKDNAMDDFTILRQPKPYFLSYEHCGNDRT
jgi:hypothetical protein